MVDEGAAAGHAVHVAGLDLEALLAVAGRPLTAAELRQVVVADSAPSRADIDRALTSAAEAGVTGVSPDGAHWFRHPLSAELLAGELSEPEQISWHAAFVRRAQQQTESGSLEDIIRLADQRTPLPLSHDGL